jgi:bifunctional DNase/RNase
MDNSRVELRFFGVSLEGDEPYVVLEDRVTDRRLQVPLGTLEASAIILELECISPPRPLTHDLLAEFFEEGGFSLEAVDLLDGASAGPRARLIYKKGMHKYEKEVRPSDALALALRLGAPVFAESSMLDRREGEVGPWHRPRIFGLDDWKTKALRA